MVIGYERVPSVRRKRPPSITAGGTHPISRPSEDLITAGACSQRFFLDRARFIPVLSPVCRDQIGCRGDFCRCLGSVARSLARRWGSGGGGGCCFCRQRSELGAVQHAARTRPVGHVHRRRAAEAARVNAGVQAQLLDLRPDESVVMPTPEVSIQTPEENCDHTHTE